MLRKMHDPLKRNPHSLTLHLAYNVDHSVVHVYENAPSEPSTQLKAVESHGPKAVRDMRKESVVQVERAGGKVIRAPGVGEEEKFEEKFRETMDEEVEKTGIEDLHMDGRPSIAPAEGSEVPRASVLEAWRLNKPSNHNITRPANSNIRTLPSSKALQKSATPT